MLQYFKKQIELGQLFTEADASEFINRRVVLGVSEVNSVPIEQYFNARVGNQLLCFMCENLQENKVDILSIFDCDIAEMNDNYIFVDGSGSTPSFRKIQLDEGDTK